MSVLAKSPFQTPVLLAAQVDPCGGVDGTITIQARVWTPILTAGGRLRRVSLLVHVRRSEVSVMILRLCCRRWITLQEVRSERQYDLF